MVALDRESMTVDRSGGHARAGARAPARRTERLTLGHFPQSFEYVSLGGCAATRSAGQASTGYGCIERMVRGLRFAAPAGDIELPALSRRAPPDPICASC